MTTSDRTARPAGPGAGSTGGLTGRVLRSCVRQHDWSLPPAGLVELLPAVDGQQLLAAARRHRVQGCVQASVRHLPGVLVPDVVTGLEADARSGLAEHMRALGVVGLLRRALDPAVTRWLVVKGPVLASHVYDRPDLRTYGDVDVLVHPAELGAAVAALEASGCELLDRNWTLLRRERLGEVHLLTPTGMVVDLHWSLFNRERLRRTFSAPTADLLDRSVPVVLAGLPVRTLDPDDTLVHLAVHAAMSGGDRLLWLKDIEQAWRHVQPRAALERADGWHARLPVAAMLSRTARVLGLETGDLDPARLLPGPLGVLLWAAEARDDFVAGGELGTARRLVTRALRGDARSSLVETGRRTLTRLRHGRHDRADKPDQPTSVLFDAGGDAGRRAYLDEVARWP